jgi:hypothetical protein
MLLGIVIAAFGIILSEQTVETFFFRNWTFLPPGFFTNVLPAGALIIALIGVVIGLTGFFQKNL